MTNIYDVQMKVPLGIRNGTLKLANEDGLITGSMKILGRVTAFTGHMYGDRFEITGVLKTVLRSNDFEGWGLIDEDDIRICLKNNDTTYEINGRRRRR